MGKSTGSRNSGPENLYTVDGIYYARIQVRGRSVRRSLKTRARDVAIKRRDALLAELSPYHSTDRKTFDEGAALWIEQKSADWKPKTRRRYDTSLNVLLPYFGGKFWDEVNKASLIAFIKDRKQHGATAATINRDLSVISGIANCVRHEPGWPEGLVNPVDLVPPDRRKAKKWFYVRPPASDVEEIFVRMPGTFGDLCRFALLTGARMDEISHLRREDAEGGKVQLWATKHRFRVVALSDEALAIVNRQKPVHGSPYLFTTRNGGRYKRITEMFREVRNRAQKLAQSTGRKVRGLRFHDLRHEYAIRYLENGGKLYLLQRNLGHTTIKQTEDYLAYLTAEQAALAID